MLVQLKPGSWQEFAVYRIAKKPGLGEGRQTLMVARPGEPGTQPPGAGSSCPCRGQGRLAHAFPAQFPALPLAPPPPKPLIPRWLQLKDFALFPFSQNKPFIPGALCWVSAGCGPGWIYVCPHVIL